MRQHIMIDTTALSLSSHGLMAALGAIRFTLDAMPPQPDEEFFNGTAREDKAYESDWHQRLVTQHLFYAPIDIASYGSVPADVDLRTVKYWCAQEYDTLDLFTGPAEPVRKVLHDFAQWCGSTYEERDNSETVFWAHGSSFDPVVLINHYRTAHMPAPCHFRQVRDTRTLFAAAKEVTGKSLLMPQVPVRHHALYTAWRQACGVVQAYQYLQE